MNSWLFCVFDKDDIMLYLLGLGYPEEKIHALIQLTGMVKDKGSMRNSSHLFSYQTLLGHYRLYYLLKK